jgi:hypothetical protein
VVSLTDLPCDGGDLPIARPAQGPKPHLLPGGEEELPDDDARKVPVGLFDQKAVAEIEHVAAEGQAVGVLATAAP